MSTSGWSQHRKHRKCHICEHPKHKKYQLCEHQDSTAHPHQDLLGSWGEQQYLPHHHSQHNHLDHHLHHHSHIMTPSSSSPSSSHLCSVRLHKIINISTGTITNMMAIIMMMMLGEHLRPLRLHGHLWAGSWRGRKSYCWLESKVWRGESSGLCFHCCCCRRCCCCCYCLQQQDKSLLQADSFVFDIIVGASGSRCVIDGFNRWAFKTFVVCVSVFLCWYFLLCAYQPQNLSRYALGIEDRFVSVFIGSNLFLCVY